MKKSDLERIKAKLTAAVEKAENVQQDEPGTRLDALREFRDFLRKRQSQVHRPALQERIDEARARGRTNGQLAAAKGKAAASAGIFSR